MHSPAVAGHTLSAWNQNSVVTHIVRNCVIAALHTTMIGFLTLLSRLGKKHVR
jgi:hypothetical protein